jgi:hypothetical protein
MNSRAMLLVSNENEKALREQGQSLLLKTPTKAQLKEVIGDYQAFKDVAIDCVQFFDREPRRASLRVNVCNKPEQGIRLAINGRAGRAYCNFVAAEQVDDLIDRLVKIRADRFGVKHD